MLTYEYKVDGTNKQYAAIDEAIRVVQFIRNKSLRLWMDERNITKNDLQVYCSVLAHTFPFGLKLRFKSISILRRVKQVLTVPPLPSNASTIIVRSRNQARRAIQSSNMTTAAWSTKPRGGS